MGKDKPKIRAAGMGRLQKARRHMSMKQLEAEPI
jgi:hypothetical protein